MELSARFVQAEDRMLLTLTTGDGARGFWITRRHWSQMLHIVDDFAAREADGAQLAADRPVQRPGERDPAEFGTPLLLTGLRFRPLEDGLRLVFLADGAPAAAVRLPRHKLFGVKSLLRRLAEGAGWDLDPALARLAAAQSDQKSRRRLH